MPNTPASDRPRLHLDENVNPRVAIRLRKQGFDVSTTPEAGLLHARDEQQLAYAAANKRVIITFDIRDYPRLNAEYLMAGQEHWGIIISTHEVWYDAAKWLLHLLDTLSADDLHNQILWLNEFK